MTAPNRGRRPLRRRTIWAALFAVAIGALILLLILVGIGTLRLSTSSGPTVTVSEVKWTVEQGSLAGGQGWFGKSVFNYTTASGWVPPSFGAGATFEISWSIVNYDSATHYIYNVTASSPFLVTGTRVALPMAVVSGDDGYPLSIYFSSPSSASGAYTLSITVDALPSSG